MAVTDLLMHSRGNSLHIPSSRRSVQWQSQRNIIHIVVVSVMAEPHSDRPHTAVSTSRLQCNVSVTGPLLLWSRPTDRMPTDKWNANRCWRPTRNNAIICTLIMLSITKMSSLPSDYEYFIYLLIFLLVIAANLAKCRKMTRVLESIDRSDIFWCFF